MPSLTFSFYINSYQTISPLQWHFPVVSHFPQPIDVESYAFFIMAAHSPLYNQNPSPPHNPPSPSTEVKKSPTTRFRLDFSLIMAAAQYSNPIPAMTKYLPLDKPVVVIGPYFLTQYPVDLTVASKLFSLGENDFKVTDINGTPIFQVKSKHFSIHDRRYLRDAAGNTLVTFKQKLRTMHRRWEAFRGESTDEKDLLFTVKKSSMLQFKTQLDVFLAANTEQKVPDFKVKGGHAQSSCAILLGDTNTPIAQMYARINLTTEFFDTDNFAVTVYPNVDYAFIVALVVVLDEINADRSAAHGIGAGMTSGAADVASSLLNM